MNKLIIKDVLDEIDGVLVCGSYDEVLNNFKINSKEVIKDDVFIGIKGNIDGSIYYKEALNNGAKGVIINNYIDVNPINNVFIIKVKDSVKALEKLATIYRSINEVPVIAVTGSFAKTSTKDMIYSVLSKKYNVLKTEENYNNNIGLSLTILRYKDEDIMLLEMGMNNKGEISNLSNIAKPNIGIITNIGTSHIGNLGSRKNILNAKLELLDNLNGYLLINNDNDLLNEWNNKNKIYDVKTIGINNNSDYNAYNINISKRNISFYCNNEKYIINNGERGYIYNALFSIMIGNIFNIPYRDISNSISNYHLTQGRCEIIELNKIRIINDCYNSSLETVKEAILNLRRYDGRKIVILGDILELGEYSKEIHKEIGNILLKENIDIIITIGREIEVIKEIINSIHFYDNESVINYLKKTIKRGDNILLKASHKMNLIDIVNYLKNNDFIV